MNVINKPQTETLSSTIDWINRTQEDAIRMSQDENYRQRVASRATNWGKGIQQEVEQQIRQDSQPILEVD